MLKKQTSINLINKRIQNLIFSAYYYAEDQEHCKEYSHLHTCGQMDWVHIVTALEELEFLFQLRKELE